MEIIDYDCLFMRERNPATEKAINELIPTIREMAKDLRVNICFTPSGVNHFYSEWKKMVDTKALV